MKKTYIAPTAEATYFVLESQLLTASSPKLNVSDEQFGQDEAVLSNEKDDWCSDSWN